MPLQSITMEEENSINPKRILFAFDMDHTLINVDSDEALASLGSPVPSEISSLFDGSYWTDYMNAIFKYIYVEHDVSLKTMAKVLKNLPPVQGVPELLRYLFQEHFPMSPNSQMVVISDANDFGISNVLSGLISSANLRRPMDSLKIPFITNKAFVSPQGYLQIKPHDGEQPHECKMCPKNLCKGRALANFIEKEGPFDHVCYVGDGTNDVCPASRLIESDFVFAREGFRLHKILEEGHKDGILVDVNANIHIWDNAQQIKETIIRKITLSEF